MPKSFQWGFLKRDPEAGRRRPIKAWYSHAAWTRLSPRRMWRTCVENWERAQRDCWRTNILSQVNIFHSICFRLNRLYFDIAFIFYASFTFPLRVICVTTTCKLLTLNLKLFTVLFYQREMNLSHRFTLQCSLDQVWWAINPQLNNGWCLNGGCRPISKAPFQNKSKLQSFQAFLNRFLPLRFARSHSDGVSLLISACRECWHKLFARKWCNRAATRPPQNRHRESVATRRVVPTCVGTYSKQINPQKSPSGAV